uniref:Uncharacterized protein n=1 Tax=Pithovirus LCPAC403 TaxID=2506596 RepID=A0A481ZBE5_9VIRU|nr:MAG: hypothetical protein LCPAC403_03870 [Pithovirus LCPAC403]
MTKSLIPYGEFEKFGNPVEYTRIIVWESEVVEQIVNEYENKTDDRLVTMKPFTADVVIGWLLEDILHESALTTYYAYICSDHGYKVTEMVVPFMMKSYSGGAEYNGTAAEDGETKSEVSEETATGKNEVNKATATGKNETAAGKIEIGEGKVYIRSGEHMREGAEVGISRYDVIQIIKIFLKLKKYKFSWGSSHVRNLYVRAYEGEDSKIVLMDHSRSTITVDGVKYAGEQSHRHCSLNNPSKKINLLYATSFRVSNSESFRMRKTRYCGALGIQYDFYSLMVSLMTWKVFRDRVDIASIWTSMWERSEFDHITRLIQEYDEPPLLEVIALILGKFTLKCSVIEIASSFK